MKKGPLDGPGISAAGAKADSSKLGKGRQTLRTTEEGGYKRSMAAKRERDS